MFKIKYLHLRFVVDNRGGAGGMIGIEMVVKVPPDGYTLMMMSGRNWLKAVKAANIKEH